MSPRSYSAWISSTRDQWVLELSGGGAFADGSCSSRRVAGGVRVGNGASLTAPSSGSTDLVLWAGSSSGYSQAVAITESCTLLAPNTPMPTASPAPTITASPSVAVESSISKATRRGGFVVGLRAVVVAVTGAAVVAVCLGG